jgi:hypothetical protein
MEKIIYPFDPDMLEASTKFGKKLGTLLVENALDDMSPERISNIATVDAIDVQNLDPQHVYNWVFQGVADVLRDPKTRKEIEQLVTNAKKLKK